MGTLAILGKEGDTKVMWDRTNRPEVDAARAQFEQLTGSGYMAFSVRKNGEKDEQIRAFDPEAESIILAPPLRGG